MRIRLMTPLLVVTLLLSRCATITYSPQIALDVSPYVIPASLKVQKLNDVSPAEDKKNAFGGFSITNTSSLTSQLDVALTNAILNDFQINGVFEKVTKFDANADYILSGEIKRFAGKSKFTTYGIVSLFSVVGIYTWYFGMPIRKNETHVEIVLTLKDRSGAVVGTYTGMFSDLERSNMYKGIALGLPAATNRSLTKAIDQIRQQLINDLKK